MRDATDELAFARAIERGIRAAGLAAGAENGGLIDHIAAVVGIWAVSELGVMPGEQGANLEAAVDEELAYGELIAAEGCEGAPTLSQLGELDTVR